jgi:hypothetical protein
MGETVVDKDNALILLENILDRIEKDEETGKYKLEGVISEKEREALDIAFKKLGGNISTHKTEKENTFSKQIDSNPYPINTDSLDLSTAQDQETILCLDFGTAMSKAFASNSDDLILYDLAVGRRAGQANPIFSVVSSIYINKSGKVLFGEQAVTESLNGDIDSSKRIDSIKDIICKDAIRDLETVPIEKEFNPTEYFFTKGDIVTLYLAYLTDMATTELVERHDSSRYVRRRFTRPVLPPERATWAEEQLIKLLAKAQILADTLHDKWNTGLDAGKLKATLEYINELDELPTYLIEDAVLEPVAAVASRVRNFEAKDDKRRLMMVVDVGAGTIDFALFVEMEKVGDALRFFEIPGSIHVLRQAGDAVDKALRRYVLKKANIEYEDPDYHLINASLIQRIRIDKEDLFNNGEKLFKLENDSEIQVTKQKFIESSGMLELQKAIHAKFIEVLENVKTSYIKELAKGVLTIIFTGGGSKLPIIRSLVNQQLSINGIVLNCIGSTPTPPWVNEEYPELENEYPPLAVAIGGCSRELPQVAPDSFDDFGGDDGTKGPWDIPPSFKGS